MENIQTIFLVDDDPLFLMSLEIEFLQLKKYTIKTFATGERCLEHLNEKPLLIVLDYYLNGIDTLAMNGIETLDKIKHITTSIPVVMLSSQDKIDVAITCMHHQALDYVVKSETSFLRLQKIIESLIHFQKIENELRWYMERM
jgi:DNA-binding NtrC family response regulator